LIFSEDAYTNHVDIKTLLEFVFKCVFHELVSMPQKDLIQF